MNYEMWNLQKKKKALLLSKLCDNLILIESERWREERLRIATVIICFCFVTGDIITQLCLAANLMEVCCYFTVNLGLPSVLQLWGLWPQNDKAFWNKGHGELVSIAHVTFMNVSKQHDNKQWDMKFSRMRRVIMQYSAFLKLPWRGRQQGLSNNS